MFSSHFMYVKFSLGDDYLSTYVIVKKLKRQRKKWKLCRNKQEGIELRFWSVTFPFPQNWKITLIMKNNLR